MLKTIGGLNLITLWYGPSVLRSINLSFIFSTILDASSAAGSFVTPYQCSARDVDTVVVELARYGREVGLRVDAPTAVV